MSNARSNWCHYPTSPNTAPVRQKDSHSESSSHMKPHLQCAEQLVSPSNLTKYCACHANGSSSSQIKPHLQCAKQLVSPSNLTKYCASQTKRLTFGILITYGTSFPMRRATGVTIKTHRVLRLSHKKIHILSPHHI